ncbi:MAG: putative cation:proton antiport protein [Methanomassiliicoccales archaeon PtaU1.Bin124]|nr:MAG: putative cation:proton antiport protein [Methanomassiliicoccales archaeon PtaU1.Bin124]
MAVESSTLLLELGAILLIAFVGSALAYRLKQSAILGYILVGILLGPFMYIEIGGYVYHGLVQDTQIVDALSQLGILLLIFFVGLEFSMEKIKRVKGPAVILSFIDVGINLFVGFLLAFGLGWPLVDSIFLAAVMAMSCSGVAMKTLIELNRMSKPETEYILGMVILEEFISMVFLAVVGGLVIKINPDFTIVNLVVGMIAFFAFFAVLAAFVIPRTVTYLSKMKSDEMFVLFMLGIVFCSAAFADYCGVPKLIGAFFIGMVFAETKVMDRMEKKISPLRDAFVAIFFVSFGMMIDPPMFITMMPVVIVAVVLILLAEMVIMPFVAYLIGFNKGASVTIGASFSARGGESVMYASVGAQLPASTKGAELNPIAGAITFVMSALCPFFIKNSYKIADRVGLRMPNFLKYGGAVVARTLGKLVFPSTFRPFKVTKKFLMVLGALVIGLMLTAATEGVLHLAIFIVTIALCLQVYRMLAREMRSVIRLIDYTNLGSAMGSDKPLTNYIAQAITLGLIMCATVCFMFPVWWPSVIVITLGYVCWFVYLMKMVYDRTCTGSRYLKEQKMDFVKDPLSSPLADKEKERGLIPLHQEIEFRERKK